MDMVVEEPIENGDVPGSCCLMGSIDTASAIVDGRWAMTRDGHNDPSQT